MMDKIRLGKNRAPASIKKLSKIKRVSKVAPVKKSKVRKKRKGRKLKRNLASKKKKSYIRDHLMQLLEEPKMD